jgi:hypothetical protein
VTRIDTAGQTLLEVLVALSAALIVLSAITTLVISNLTQSVQSKSTNAATQYAQEGMELAQGRRGYTAGEQFCLGSDKVFRPGSCASANIGFFKREVSLTKADCGSLVKVTVTVSWSSSACHGASFCHTVPVSSCI